jgi:BirA family biotin operon repressor/biotin-[acetyl-CoA-carboxylase] ligase
MSGRLDAAALMRALGTRRVGRAIHCVDETGSTNDDAFALARAQGRAADGMVVLAERQSAGRGRMGRRWASPRGAGVLCSVVWCDDAGESCDGGGDSDRDGAALTASPMLLSLGAGVAVCEAVATSSDVRAVLRWPNDVFVGERKLGGILIERRMVRVERASGRGAAGDSSESDAGSPFVCDEAIGVTVIGIGLNCLQQRGHFDQDAAVDQPATSLEIESSRPVDRSAVVVALLRSLDAMLSENGGAETITARWREFSDDVGRRVTVRAGDRTLTGTIVGVDPAAALQLALDDGQRVICPASISSVLRTHSD